MSTIKTIMKATKKRLLSIAILGIAMLATLPRGSADEEKESPYRTATVKWNITVKPGEPKTLTYRYERYIPSR